MVGLGSGAENHTLLLNLEISIHFRSTISGCASLFVTFPKQKLENYFILQIAYKVNRFPEYFIKLCIKEELTDICDSVSLTFLFEHLPGTLSL